MVLYKLEKGTLASHKCTNSSRQVRSVTSTFSHLGLGRADYERGETVGSTQSSTTIWYDDFDLLYVSNPRMPRRKRCCLKASGKLEELGSMPLQNDQRKVSTGHQSKADGKDEVRSELILLEEKEKKSPKDKGKKLDDS